jgi:hypothetical protein
MPSFRGEHHSGLTKPEEAEQNSRKFGRKRIMPYLALLRDEGYIAIEWAIWRGGVPHCLEVGRDVI